MKIFSTPLRKAHIVIHGFAVAHAVTAAVIIAQHADPGIILTIFTIAMIVVLSRLNDYPLDVTTAVALICCLAGFYLGTIGAEWMAILFSGSAMASQILTTVLITELLGWLTYLIVRRTQRK